LWPWLHQAIFPSPSTCPLALMVGRICEFESWFPPLFWFNCIFVCEDWEFAIKFGSKTTEQRWLQEVYFSLLIYLFLFPCENKEFICWALKLQANKRWLESLRSQSPAMLRKVWDMTNTLSFLCFCIPAKISLIVYKTWTLARKMLIVQEIGNLGECLFWSHFQSIVSIP
jgi:hypothetical protein